jgi:hypothetical protein
MFFPNINNNNTFFIKEEELESLSFKQVVENRRYDMKLIKTIFKGVDINFDLSMINFLQKLFNHPGVIGKLSTGREYAYFQVLQPKISNHLNRNIENIDKNINDDEYGLPSNNINIEEDQVLNENETKEETKEEKKENLPPGSNTYFETHSSNQQKESEKNEEQHIL